MNVPPFIPPQIEIAGNVAEEKYAVRIGFIKRVVLLHAAFSGFILAVSLAPMPEAKLAVGAVLTLASLLGLSLVRGLAKGWRHEQFLSGVCVPPLVAGIAMLVKCSVEAGWPFWIFGLPSLATLLYTMSSGRDVSFVGMFTLTAIGSTTTLVVGWASHWFSTVRLGEAVAAVLAYLLFYVYDLAALQTRRRLGEEFGAVLDLFRDVLNFTTYPIRVINHWRRHRIWSRG